MKRSVHEVACTSLKLQILVVHNPYIFVDLQADLVEKYLDHTYKRMEEDPVWQGIQLCLSPEVFFFECTVLPFLYQWPVKNSETKPRCTLNVTSWATSTRMPCTRMEMEISCVTSEYCLECFDIIHADVSDRYCIYWVSSSSGFSLWVNENAVKP